MKLSTGVLVLYADDESFTLMTPEGHMLAGWITFSAWAADDEVTVVQIQALERTNDPLYELGYVLGGNRLNTRFWVQTGENLARPAARERRAAGARAPRPPPGRTEGGDRPPPLGGRAEGRVPGGLRGPPPPVAQGRQHLEERRRPHRHLDPGHPAALAARPVTGPRQPSSPSATLPLQRTRRRPGERPHGPAGRAQRRPGAACRPG